jgi:hypothetical protein
MLAGGAVCFDFIAADENHSMRRTVAELQRYYRRWCAH